MVAMFSVRFLAFAVLVVLVAGIPTANAQGSWSTVTSPTTNFLYSVFMVGASDGWAVGYGGTILHYSGPAPPVVAAPVGGSIASVNKLAVSAPYLSLLLVIGAAAVAVATKRKRKA